MTGMNGESFLAEVLAGGETEKILEEYGLNLEQVVKFVTGEDKPLSDVLNGTMDIDNLDNVARYAYFTGQKGARYDGVKIASSFRFLGSEWVLTGFGDEIKKWQSARAKVYGAIYQEPHLNAAMAVYYLLMCNPGTASLVKRANRWDWYKEVFAFETAAPSDAVKNFTDNWMGRTLLADSIAEALKVGKEKVCAYAGRGKNKKGVDIPLCKIKIYLAPECADKTKEVLEIMSQKINAPVS